MNGTETILKIIEAERAAQSHTAELEAEKTRFAEETEGIIAALRAQAYKKADGEIEKQKADFARVQSERVEKEKKKSADEIKRIEQKRKDSLDSVVEKCFREIVEG